MKKLLSMVIALSIILSFAAVPAHAAAFSDDNVVYTDVGGLQNKWDSNFTVVESTTVSSNRYNYVYLKRAAGTALSGDKKLLRLNWDVGPVSGYDYNGTVNYAHSRFFIALNNNANDQKANLAIMLNSSTGSSDAQVQRIFTLENGVHSFYANGSAENAVLTRYDDDGNGPWTVRQNSGEWIWHQFDLIVDVDGANSGMVYGFIDGRLWGYTKVDANKLDASSKQVYHGYTITAIGGTFTKTNDEVKIKLPDGNKLITCYANTDDYKVTLEDVINHQGLSDDISGISNAIMKTSDLYAYMPGGYVYKNSSAADADKLNANVTYNAAKTVATIAQNTEDATQAALMVRGAYPITGSNGIGYSSYTNTAKWIRLSFNQEIKSGDIQYNVANNDGTEKVVEFRNDDGNLLLSSADDNDKTLESVAYTDKARIDVLLNTVDKEHYIYVNNKLESQGTLSFGRINNISILTKGDASAEISDWSMTLYNNEQTIENFTAEFEELYEKESGKLSKITDYANNISYFCNMDNYNAITNQSKVLDFVSEILTGVTLINNDQASCTAVENAFKTAILIESLNEGLVDNIQNVQTNTYNALISTDNIDELNDVGKNKIFSLLSNQNFKTVNAYQKTLAKAIFVNVMTNLSDTSTIDKETFFEDNLAVADFTVSIADIQGLYSSDLYEKISQKNKVTLLANEILSGELLSDNYNSFKKAEDAIKMGALIVALNENKVEEIETVKINTTNSNIGTSYIDYLTEQGKSAVLSALPNQNFETAQEYKEKFDKALFLNVMLNSEDSVDKDSFFNSNIDAAAFDVDDRISDFFTDPSDDVVNTINGFTKEQFENTATLSTLVDIITGKRVSTPTKKTYFDNYAAGLELNLTSYNALASDASRENVINRLATADLTAGNIQELLNSFVAAATEVPSPAQSDGVSSSGSGVSVTGGYIPSAQSGGAAGKTTFTDMASYSWATNAVSALKQKGIISGYADDKFMPQNSVTRAEFIAMMVRAYIPNATATEGKFGDVSQNDWFYNSVMVAFEKGIINGVTDTQFMPNQQIKRQDMAVILYNLAEKLGKGAGSGNGDFVDGSSVSDYAKTAVSFLKSAGVVKGDETGAFNPHNFANRAEAAQMIYTFMQRIGEGVLR